MRFQIDLGLSREENGEKRLHNEQNITDSFFIRDVPMPKCSQCRVLMQVQRKVAIKQSLRNLHM